LSSSQRFLLGPRALLPGFYHALGR
jgi:hypothetical protein